MCAPLIPGSFGTGQVDRPPGLVPAAPSSAVPSSPCALLIGGRVESDPGPTELGPRGPKMGRPSKVADSDAKPGRCRAAAAPSGQARPGPVPVAAGQAPGRRPGVSWRQGATAAMRQGQAPGFWSRLARSDGRIMIPPILEATRLARDIPGSAAQGPRVPSRTAWRT